MPVTPEFYIIASEDIVSDLNLKPDPPPRAAITGLVGPGRPDQKDLSSAAICGSPRLINSFHRQPTVNRDSDNLSIYRFFSILFLLFFLAGCVSLRPVPVPLHLSDQQLSALIDQMVLEQQKVDSFFINGILNIRNWQGDAEVAVLAVGTRTPFRLKIEVAHSWGAPLLHMVIDQGRMEVLSFSEQTYYYGVFKPQWISRFLGVELSPDIIWATLRGYPLILVPDGGRIEGAHPILIREKDNRLLEQITVHAQTLLPEEVVFPQSKLSLRFSEFQENNQVLFAKKIEIARIDKKPVLSLRYEEAVMNREVPPQIFLLQKPAGFKTVELNEPLLDSPR